MRKKIVLVCDECKQRNYNTTKNPRKQSSRIERKKYCKWCDKRTTHKEKR